MSMYVQLARTASRLLRSDLGQDVILKSISHGTYNVATGELDYNSESESSRRGVLQLFRADETTLQGNLVQVSDRKLIMDVGTVVPQIDDLVVVGGVEYQVVSVSPEKPGDILIYYTLHVRVA